MTHQGGNITDQERLALDNGFARLHNGRVIPIIRGAEGEGGEGAEGAGESGGGAGEGAAGEGSAGAAGSGEGQGAARTFSQADVDRIVQDRLARAKTTPPADYEDLKAKAERLAEIEEANKSEHEKAVARAEAAEAERDKIKAEATETRLTSAILAEAAKADRKVVDPEAAVALLDRSSLELDANGMPTNIAEAMDSLLKARPFLVASEGARGDADQGARGGGANQLTAADLKSMSPEAIAKAESEGRLTTVMGSSGS